MLKGESLPAWWVSGAWPLNCAGGVASSRYPLNHRLRPDESGENIVAGWGNSVLGQAVGHISDGWE
jgi:hypothetical protein